MSKKSNILASGKTFWATSKKSVSAEKDLSLILGSVIRLPLKYWQNSFFFTGAADNELSTHTAGKFPRTTRNGKTHPIFSLMHLPNNAGFRVCPCSSIRPFYSRTYRWIKKGCHLEYTDHEMDKNSHLIDTLWFNVPGAMALAENESLMFYLRYGKGMGLQAISGYMGSQGRSAGRSSYWLEKAHKRLKTFLRELPRLSPEDLNEGPFLFFGKPC